MTSERPFTRLLNPELAKVEAVHDRQVVKSLFTELVNHATHAFARCSREASGEPDVDFAPLGLYHQTITMTDAIGELLEECSVRGSLPAMRSLAEAVLGLGYLFEDAQHFRERSLSWYCVHLHEEIRECDRFDPSTQLGAELKEAWERQFDRPWATPQETQAAIKQREVLEGALQQQHLSRVVAEYRRLKRPKWFSLFGGPPHLRELTMRLRRLPDYDVFYSRLSSAIHGTDFREIFSVEDGQAAFWAVRVPTEMAWVARGSASYMIEATKMMLEHYRDGEQGALRRWYRDDLKPLLDRLEAIDERRRSATKGAAAETQT